MWWMIPSWQYFFSPHGTSQSNWSKCVLTRPHLLQKWEEYKGCDQCVKGRCSRIWDRITKCSSVAEVLVPNLFPLFLSLQQHKYFPFSCFLPMGHWLCQSHLPLLVTLLHAVDSCRWETGQLEGSWDPVCWIPETSVGKIRWLYFHPSFLSRTAQSTLCWCYREHEKRSTGMNVK